MVSQIIYILEILAILSCIHCIYGAPIHIERKTVITFLTLYTCMNLANKHQIAVEYTVVMYIGLAVYCVKRFKRGFRENTINYVLFMIVLTLVEFICGVLISLVIREKVLVKTLISTILTAGLSSVVLPKLELSKVANWALKKNVIFYLSLVYISLFVGAMISQFKLLGNLTLERYVLGVPIIIFLLLCSRQWAKYQSYYEDKERELHAHVENSEKYTEFIKKIRMRQHDINNHITAILALHYTKTNYEDLVRAQREYCNRIMAENKFNALLSLGDNVLIGFLYEKFENIQKKGIEIICKVSVREYNPNIPDYYLIEAMGILLDNAVEAVMQNDLPQKMQVIIQEKEAGYVYIVRNPFYHVKYDQIQQWFEFEHSTKGHDRGMGLHHLRSICLEWDCGIGCNNIEYQNINWIEFVIETGREG